VDLYHWVSHTPEDFLVDNHRYPESDTASLDLAEAAPFLKWAGGKRSLLDQYDALFPRQTFNTYFEPFVGSGAVFFHLRARGVAADYRLSDLNRELVNIFQVVRDCVDELLAVLAEHEEAHKKRHYYQVRKWDRQEAWPDAWSRVERAARMIYLNRTCFNGLWRVNSAGQFNVPIGSYENPNIRNEKRLRAASLALQGVEVHDRSFEQVVDDAGPGDFVYFDPPYVPLSDTSNFTSYHRDGFGPLDQELLAKVCAQLDARGVTFMLSNSATETVRGLYEGFHIHTVKARRAINSDANGRGAINEVVVTNYPVS
jgi:DNA adenine methylase